MVEKSFECQTAKKFQTQGIAAVEALLIASKGAYLVGCVGILIRCQVESAERQICGENVFDVWRGNKVENDGWTDFGCTWIGNVR